MCTIDSADASKYDADRWEAYAKSFAYAQKVSTSFNASTTMRTQVREAMNNLIYNWKRLIPNPVVTVTFTFTVNGETHAVLTGNQGDPVDLSSIEAPAAPVGMHFVGWGNVPATFDADATFEAQFANNTDTKYTVNVYTMDTTGNYPEAPDSTYQAQARPILQPISLPMQSPLKASRSIRQRAPLPALSPLTVLLSSAFTIHATSTP